MKARWRPRMLRILVLGGGLATVVLAAYTAAPSVGRLVGADRPGWPAWLSATAAVAIAVPLLRPRLDRLADRLAYGPDGDTYAVMNRFVQRISDALAVDDVLPNLAETATRALHSPHLCAEAMGAARFPSAVEAATYFCAVALVDDAARHCTCTLELAHTSADHGVELRMHASTVPSAEVAALVRDRAEAAGGTVDLGPPVIVRIPAGAVAAVPAQSTRAG